MQSSAAAEDLPDASFAGQQDTASISPAKAPCSMRAAAATPLPFTHSAISYCQIKGFYTTCEN